MKYEEVKDITTKLKSKVKKVAANGADFVKENAKDLSALALLTLGIGTSLHSMTATGRDQITMNTVEAAAGALLAGGGIAAKRGFGKTYDDVKAFGKQIVADEEVVDRAIKIKKIKEMKARQA